MLGTESNCTQLQEALFYFEKAAQLGDSQGMQYVVQVRQMLGVEETEPQDDPIELAFGSFEQAGSLADMRQAVAEFPFMTDINFIANVEQFIIQQIPLKQQPPFNRCLVWLRQIANEQADVQLALTTFREANSIDEMRRVVTKFPFVADTDFIAELKQFINQQISPEHQSASKQRLAWIYQIANKQ